MLEGKITNVDTAKYIIIKSTAIYLSFYLSLFHTIHKDTKHDKYLFPLLLCTLLNLLLPSRSAATMSHLSSPKNRDSSEGRESMDKDSAEGDIEEAEGGDEEE